MFSGLWGSSNGGLGCNGSGAADVRRLQDCLKQVAEAERLLANTRTTINQLVQDVAPSSRNGRQSSPGSAVDKDRCRKVFKRANTDYIGLEHLQGLLVQAYGYNVPDDVFERCIDAISTKNSAQGHFNEADFIAACSLLPDFDEENGYSEYNSMRKAEQSDDQLTEDDNVDLEEMARNRGVEKEYVLRYLHKEKEEREACLQLPGAFALVLFFALACTFHMSFDKLYATDQAITYDIEENGNFAFSGIYPWENGRIGHKNVYDVNIVPDFYSWFSLGMVPLWWATNESFGWSETRANIMSQCTGAKDALAAQGYPAHNIVNVTDAAPGYDIIGDATCPVEDPLIPSVGLEEMKLLGEPFTHTYLYYHTVIGGARLTQEQRAVIECRGDPVVTGATHFGKCLEEIDYWLQPEIYNAISLDTERINKPGGETVYLLSRWTQPQVNMKMQELENRYWFNPLTAKIEILFTTYNAHSNFITAHFIIFFQNQAGHLHKVIDPVSIWIDNYSSLWNYIVDVIWASLIMKLFIEELAELTKHWRDFGIIEGTKGYAGFWNFVDWLSFLFAFAIMSMWGVHLLRLRDLKAMIAMAQPDTPGSWTDPQIREEFFDLVHEIVTEMREFRIVLGMYPFVIVSKFFKAFNSQPRLSMVTRTLSQAAVDITHFAIVFFTVFCIYALSALIIFGKELKHFANFHRSLHSTFLVLLGDFDWESMIHVGRPQSYLWFWSLIWLVNLVMLNMLLAIVMEVYNEVRNKILMQRGVETMWSQAWEIYVNTINNYRGTHTPIRLILRTLAGSDVAPAGEASKRVNRMNTGMNFDESSCSAPQEAENELLTVDSLIQQFPRTMSEEQALDILTNAADLHISDTKDSADKIVEDNRRMLGHIRRCVDNIAYDVCAWNGHGESSYGGYNGVGASTASEPPSSNGYRSNGHTTEKTDGLDWPGSKDDAGYLSKGNGKRPEWSI